MTKKNFSAIADMLKNNGVGCVNLVFRSNIHPGYLNKIDNKVDIEQTGCSEKEWVIDFSDNHHYLGSLIVPFEVLNCLDLNVEIDTEHPDYDEEHAEFSIWELRTPELETYFGKNNQPEFYFKFISYVGTCLIACNNPTMD